MSSAGKMTDPTPNQGGVLLKLVGFSLAVALAPVATYFLTLTHVFDGNATYAAIAAVVAANMVLVAYVTVAFKEDQQAQNHSAASKKKV